MSPGLPVSKKEGTTDMNGKHFPAKPHGGKPFAAIENIEATSPYNFVPLSEKVFFPEWATAVSHDIPFKEGVNGELLCEIVTATPAYVRNGGTWKDHAALMNDSSAWDFFCVEHGGKKQFLIPGTTLKGMLRNVIEIASFGKFSRVDNHRYSVRDLNNKDKSLYMDWMTKTVGNKTYESKIRAGWLKISDDEAGRWIIQPCRMSRVEHNSLVAYHGGKPDIKSKQSGPNKYKNWGNTPLRIMFDPGETDNHPHSCGHLRYSKAGNLGKGQTEGTIVFTGQPGDNKRDFDPKNRSKHFEFIFHGKGGNEIEVPKQIRQDFIFNHSDVNETPNEEWKYWKSKLKEGTIPVFYRLTDDGKALHSIGLAMMYRLPYKHRIHDAIRHSSEKHLSAQPDLAEVIFGSVPDGKAAGNEALKGRVSICPAIADLGTCRPWKDENERYIQTVLGGPKPTFYPNYLEQPAKIDQFKGPFYSTYMNDTCRLRGWKRYPARKPETVTRQSVPKGVTNDVDTRMIPLAPKARFTFRVKLHNMLPAEVGAIIWALTWGGRPHLRHSFGMGKPFGFGQATITIDSSTSNLFDMNGESITVESTLESYRNLMQHFAGKDWEKSREVEQLLAMADPSAAPAPDKLKYPVLTVKPNRNDFAEIKKQGKVLASHVPTGSYLSKIAVAPAAAARPVTNQQNGSENNVWENAFLVYNPGGGNMVIAQQEGMTATLAITAEAEKLFPPSILEKLKGKKRTATATITVEPIGGKRYRIIKVVEI